MNKQKIIEVLTAEGALIAGRLENKRKERCQHAGRCAVGALMVAAGIDVLEKEYGLNDDQVLELMEYNDECTVAGKTVHERDHDRMEKVIQFVKEKL